MGGVYIYIYIYMRLQNQTPLWKSYQEATNSTLGQTSTGNEQGALV